MIRRLMLLCLLPPALAGCAREDYADLRAFMEQAPWLAIFPGLAISLAVLGFNLFGDGLRDALDPRLK